ncbi:MAG: sucrose-6-phosphate hydrolase [Spirochaetales bacterium]|nr:sucrose-6-phosphate hydrolase [Spirochaetales bacterium]
MERNLLYLDTYVLQQDMRIRLPKSIVENLKAKKGITMFSIYLDSTSKEIVLRIADDKEVSNGSKN